MNRMGHNRLSRLTSELSGRDKEILLSLKNYRYLTTNQLRRLHFRDSATDIAALRAANRILAKLKDLGVVAALERRIGGVRAGSGSFVWTLSPTGARLLALIANAAGKPVRKRFYEPSPAFLEHTLAVAEVSIRLMEPAFSESHTSLVTLQNEPDCWRTFAGAGGAAKCLKPDLFAITSTDDYEDHWFMEIDLATESPSQVVRKCGLYVSYRKSGREQQKTGVFPFVVWIVPDAKRKDAVRRHIADNLHGSVNIFAVITLDELGILIEQGADGFAPGNAKGGICND
jgi:hypothetical protein